MSMAADDELPKLIATGMCWCGCGTNVGSGSYFAPGHDKQAEALLLAVEFGGSVAQMLHRFGFGPQHSLQDYAVKVHRAERCGAADCDYVARPDAVAAHRKNRGH
jgi:hypothetical protein